MNTHELTISQAHESLTAGKFTCTELLNACFEQIRKYDPELKAFITLCEESALKQAKKVDEKLKRGESIGMLEGIPYSAKEG